MHVGSCSGQMSICLHHFFLLSFFHFWINDSKKAAFNSMWDLVCRLESQCSLPIQIVHFNMKMEKYITLFQQMSKIRLVQFGCCLDSCLKKQNLALDRSQNKQLSTCKLRSLFKVAHWYNDSWKTGCSMANDHGLISDIVLFLQRFQHSNVWHCLLWG